MLDTTLDLNTEVLESLNFEIPCDHSNHHASQHHAGPGEFIAQVTHYCVARPDVQGERYVCCAKWADKVISHMDEPWRCPHCKVTTRGRDMVIIVGTLDIM